jgi:hypothetical protein
VKSAPPLTPNVDDLTALLFEHVRDGKTRAQEHPAQMYLDHAVPGLDRHLGKLEGIEHARIIDENIDRPEFLDGRVHHCADIVDLTYVGAHRDGIAAVAPEDVGDFAGRLLVLQIVHDDPRAFGAESLGNTAAQTTAASRDHGNLACQSSFAHS